jgi:hypothetical protein
VVARLLGVWVVTFVQAACVIPPATATVAIDIRCAVPAVEANEPQCQQLNGLRFAKRLPKWLAASSSNGEAQRSGRRFVRQRVVPDH